MEGQYIIIGRVSGLHGIKGKLRIHYYNERRSDFLSYRKVYLEDRDGHFQPHEIQEARIHRKFISARLKGCEGIADAEKFIGASVLVKRKNLPPLEEGEYYWFEIIGMDVVTDDGRSLGRVKTILPTGGNDVYIVRGNGREWLIPAIEEVIVRVDRDKGQMVIHPIEGLLGE
ncbi:MAG: 16S rRNA processing protein RimM [Syntrophobacterales bacterium]|nr:MAG: 16S rRNA processing protein RimM [Syntrophobacterales bacterium]